MPQLGIVAHRSAYGRPPFAPAGLEWCPSRRTKWSPSSGCCPRWWWTLWPLQGRAWWQCRWGDRVQASAWRIVAVPLPVCNLCCCAGTGQEPNPNSTPTPAMQPCVPWIPSLDNLQLGRGDVAEARAVSNRLLGIGLGAGAALAAAFWLAEPIIPGIFSSDAGACVWVVCCRCGMANAECAGVRVCAAGHSRCFRYRHFGAAGPEQPTAVHLWARRAPQCAVVLPIALAALPAQVVTACPRPLCLFCVSQRWAQQCVRCCPSPWPCCPSMRRCMSLMASLLAPPTSSLWRVRHVAQPSSMFALVGALHLNGCQCNCAHCCCQPRAAPLSPVLCASFAASCSLNKLHPPSLQAPW